MNVLAAAAAAAAVKLKTVAIRYQKIAAKHRIITYLF